MEIVKSILTQNPCFKAGKRIAVKGLMLHSVGCPQPSAESFVRKWNNPEASRACVHAFVDGGTGKVYQTLPWDYRAWHCGGGANNTHISVEMCEPSCIRYTGGASFSCSDPVEAMEVVKRTYEASVELFAWLSKEYRLNPLADGVIISHKEGHDRGLASGHGDPDHLWRGLSAGYNMDGFRRDVAAAMENMSSAGQESWKSIPKQNPIEEKSVPAGERIVLTGKESAMPECRKGGNVSISSGDLVALSADAVYYGGKPMPEWVKNDHWRVKSISGDRAVIDGNADASRFINSPVDVKFLRRV